MARLRPNTTYTISAMVKATATIAGGYNQTILVHLWNDENPTNINQDIPGAHDTAIGTTWKKIYQTFTTPDSANLTYCRVHFYPMQANTTLYVGYVKLEEGTFATDFSLSPEDTTEGIISAFNASSNKISTNAASVLAATVSLYAITGAGFRAGSLEWNQYGQRTAGYGVAMTPGGIVAYSPSGQLSFSLDATTGAAYFAGDLAADTATFDSIKSSSATSFQQDSFACANGVWAATYFYMHHAGYASVIATGGWNASGPSASWTIDVGLSQGLSSSAPTIQTGIYGSFSNTAPPLVGTLMISGNFGAGWNTAWYKLDITSATASHVGSLAIFKSYQ
jgi:hypothetical protein